LSGPEALHLASYYRARHYDPSGGRFVSEDPIGFVLGTNFYRYAVNSPTLLTRLDWAGGSPLDWKDFWAFR